MSYAEGTLTSTLTNNVASSFDSLTWDFSSNIYGEDTSLSLAVTPSTRITPSYLIVTLSSSFTVLSGTTISCTSWTC